MLGAGWFYIAPNIIPGIDGEGDLCTLSISINPLGGGSVSPPSSNRHEQSTQVTLTATASTGYQFYKWSGGASGTGPTITITMDSDKSVTAYFIPVKSDVTLSTLVSPDRSGTITRNPDKDKYKAGTKVILTAIPASGHHFVSWSGDLGSNTNPITITMNGNEIVTASFAINTYTTTASAGSGGSINPSGQVTVKYGANQSFSIAPDTGYHIHKILVDGASIDVVSNYTFTNVTADHSIVASFTQQNLTLSVNINGSGSVTKNPDQPTYSYGDLVTLTAIPISGYRFDSWSGDASDTNPTTTLIMDRDRNVIANFVRQFTLSTSVIPAGSGTISLAPTGGVYDSGARVTVTATPASDYEFDRWSGDISDTNHTITITMDSDKSMVANFKKFYQRIEDTMPGVPIFATSSVVYSKSIQLGSKVDGFVRLTGQYYNFDVSYEWQFQIIGPGGESVHLWKGHWVNNNYHEFSFTASYAGTYKIRVYHVSNYSKNLTIEVWPPGWY